MFKWLKKLFGAKAGWVVVQGPWIDPRTGTIYVPKDEALFEGESYYNWCMRKAHGGE